MRKKNQNKNILGLPNDTTKRYYLFNPGPVMVSEDIKKKLLLPDMCHREIEFSDLLNNVSKKLNTVFKANQGYTSLVLTGSGTCAMETVISSCIHNKVLCISNGAFGERWSEIASRYNIKQKCLKYSWGEYPNANDVEYILENDKEIDSILLVHAETSTGMLNPIQDIGELAKKYKKLFLVDAVSSLAVDDLDLVKDNVDFCVSSSNKGIGSIPGLSLICLRDSTYNTIKDIKPRNYYCDIRKYLEYKINTSQTPTTPAVQSFYALDKALDLLTDEGVDTRINRTKNFSELIRKKLINFGFNLFLKDHFSNGITNILIPYDCSYKKIHDYLKKKGFIIYPGKGELSNKIFQISTIGINKKEIIDNFLNEVENMRKDLNLI